MNGEARGVRSAQLAILVGVVLLVVLAVQRDYGPEGYWIPWKALALCALGFGPGALFGLRRAAGRSGGHRVPLVALVAAVHGMYFGLPVLLADRVTGYWIEPDARAVSRALDLALLGLGSFWGAVQFARRAGVGGQGLKLKLAPGRAVPLALGLAATGGIAALAAEAGLVPPLLAQPARLIAFGLPFGVGLGILLARTGQLPALPRLGLLFVAMPLLVLLEMSVGRVLPAVVLGGFFLALLWGSGARIPLWAFGAVLVAGVVLRGGAMEYRVIRNQAPHLLPEGKLEQVATFATLAVREVSDGGGDRVLDAVRERISLITVLAHVAHLTPQAVPHWGGTSYATLPATFVPRALWPEKPENRLGQDFGHRYAILDADDRTTSINFPFLVEFYANFGVAGLAFGMGALGLLFGAAERWLFGPAAGPVAILFGAVVVRSALNVESDLSQLIGSIFQQGLVLSMFVLPFTVRSARRAPLRLVGARA